jgi:hypothetical protein
MTVIKTLHKNRCENCAKNNKDDCPFSEYWKSTWHSDVYYFIGRMGCGLFEEKL